MKINTILSVTLFATMVTTTVQAQEISGNVQRTTTLPRPMRVENLREAPEVPEVPEIFWNNGNKKEFKDLQS